MRLSRLFVPVVVLAMLLPGVAHALSSCSSSVGLSGSASQFIGEFNAHGFGGGFIGEIPLPAISGVTPTPTATEADVVGALLGLDYIGVLGGGTAKVRPLLGVGGGTTSLAGAMRVDALLFTGHFKAEPRSYDCVSVTRPGTVVHFTYFEITVSGLLTPTIAGSPLKSFAQGLQISVGPGDNSPK